MSFTPFGVAEQSFSGCPMQAVTVAAIGCGVPLLVEAREIVAAFQAMVRKKSLAITSVWLNS